MKNILCLVGLLGFILTCWPGCGVEDELTAEEQVAPVSFKFFALDSSCSSSGASEPVATYKVKVVRWDGGKAESLVDDEFPGSSTSFTITDVPEGAGLELTMLGMPAGEGAEPVMFARARNIIVQQDKTTEIGVPVAPYADYSCVAAPPGASNLMFHTATALPDGRVLIAGGFRKVSEETKHFEISQVSDLGYIYDPETSELRQVNTHMNKGRAAHVAIFLPKSSLVLLVGGTERLFMEREGGCFPWYFLKEKAGDVGYTYELFDTNTEKFLQWDTEEWPDEDTVMVKQARRVFPTASLNNDGTVLIAGGGQWPSCRTMQETDTDYRVAELYRPMSVDYTGGFQDSHGALTMKAMRTGHSAALLEVKDKLNYHIFWGGTEDGPIAEIYQESSGQLDGNFGVFTSVVWLDDGSYKKRPYFHTFTPLQDRKFLVIGGASNSSGELKEPQAADAYLVDAKADRKIGVKKISGLDQGRYFHIAASHDASHVMIQGGFGAVVQGEETLFADAATSDLRFFNLTDKEIKATIDAPALPRGGHTATALANDCILLVGGADQPHLGLEFGSNAVPLVAEILCPSVLCPEGLWANTCYQL